MTYQTMTIEKMVLSDAPRERYYEIKDDDMVLLDDTEMGRDYTLRLRDVPPQERPREKLMKHGPAVLASSELLAIIFGVGTVKEDVLAMSRRLIKEYGQAIVSERDPAKVSRLLDISVTKACQLVACFELGRRFFKMPEARSPVILRNASQAFAYLKDMREEPKENLRGLYLDAHYMLIHDELISVGSMTANIVNPPEVFRPALEWSAAAIILAHNHPTGVVTPSVADIEITKQIVAAGKLLGVPVLDHIVVTKSKFESVPVEY
jgi:DNA repair protein RadC